MIWTVSHLSVNNNVIQFLIGLYTYVIINYYWLHYYIWYDFLIQYFDIIFACKIFTIRIVYNIFSLLLFLFFNCEINMIFPKDFPKIFLKETYGSVIRTLDSLNVLVHNAIIKIGSHPIPVRRRQKILKWNKCMNIIMCLFCILWRSHGSHGSYAWVPCDWV